MHPKFYIAGPFFNEGQTALIKRIEESFGIAGIPFFSPRCLHDDFDDAPPPIDTPEAASGIFNANVGALERCQALLAVLDYNLPPGHQLNVINHDHGEVVANLRLPDTGTVFEIGCAYAKHIPIIGFTQASPEVLNVMLVRSMKGVLFSIPELLAWLQELAKIRKLGTALGMLPQWEGGLR